MRSGGLLPGSGQARGSAGLDNTAARPACVAAVAGASVDQHRVLAELDTQIEETFQQHRLATIITSMPGFGHLLAAELLAATNGDVTNFSSPDRLGTLGH